MDNAAFLRRVPVLADLSDELLDQLASEAREVRVRAGEWLLREGEQADSLYVIRSGRLEVLDEGPPETVIRVLRRGEAVGELALLHAGVRTVSVKARRDSDLLELSRDRFEGLIQDVPAFAVGLTRAIGAQLAVSRTPATAAKLPNTVAVLGLSGGAPALEVAELLVKSLRDHGSVAELAPRSDQSHEEMVAALDRAEAGSDCVVLIGGAHLPGEEWTDFCLREADLVLAVCGGAPERIWVDCPDALLGCELLAIGPHVGSEVIAAIEPREVQVLRDPADLRRSIESIARRLRGKALGVVFSGGGARAFAHLGVMEELRAAGLTIDRIGGVSLGSVVGAGMALGEEPDELIERFRGGFVEMNPTGDYTLPWFSLVRGRRTGDLLRGFLGEHRIEELPTRFFCVSCDLIARESVVHRTGSLFSAVRASLSIPGVFPPVPTEDGRLLVDGGVLDNLPVATMACTGEGPVIAVDVSGKTGGFKRPSRPGVARLSRPVRRFLTTSEAELPRLGETIVRTVTVGSIDTADAARRHADLLIQPAVEGVGLLDWGQLDRVREIGRAAARAALESEQGSVLAVGA